MNDVTTPQPPASANKPIGIAPTPSVPNVAAAKLPGAPRFVSPMPKIKDVDDEIPAYLTIFAVISIIVTFTFTVLLYLKR